MALDIAILDDSGSPAASVSIGVDAHWELVQLARSENLGLLLRLTDYHGEASYFRQELDALSRELEIVSGRDPSRELSEFTRTALDLCDSARSAGRGLEALPD